MKRFLLLFLTLGTLTLIACDTNTVEQTQGDSTATATTYNTTTLGKSYGDPETPSVLPIPGNFVSYAGQYSELVKMAAQNAGYSTNEYITYRDDPDYAFTAEDSEGNCYHVYHDEGARVYSVSAHFASDNAEADALATWEAIETQIKDLPGLLTAVTLDYGKDLGNESIRVSAWPEYNSISVTWTYNIPAEPGEVLGGFDE